MNFATLATELAVTNKIIYWPPLTIFPSLKSDVFRLRIPIALLRLEYPAEARYSRTNTGIMSNVQLTSTILFPSNVSVPSKAVQAPGGKYTFRVA